LSGDNVDAGSFRDPSGRVYIFGGRVFRTVAPLAAPNFEYVRATGLTGELIKAGWLVSETPVAPEFIGDHTLGAAHVLEHPLLPFISYPYEWSFSALRAAALRHLDVHMRALEKGVTLSDATAYNIQFQGPQPVFIDHLLFRRYREGEYWDAHAQFCQQFLNPLLLRAICGVPHNAWYRGNQEGIPVVELNRLLPWRSKLSWNVFAHVSLQARFQNARTTKPSAEPVTRKSLPKAAFLRMLESLRHWISRLTPADTGETVWSEYSQKHSYSGEEAAAKKAFVAAFAAATKPPMIWDLGCNTGHYSKAALEAGAELAIGFDYDQGALDLAYARAVREKLNFLPVFFDAANPTPDQGWAEHERKGSKRDDIWDDQCKRVPFQFAKVKELVQRTEPTFVFAHILVPHFPFVFDETGRCMSQAESDKLSTRDKYVGQVKYANKEVMALVNALMDLKEKPIIIVQSDEGPFPQKYGDEDAIDWTRATPAELQEKFRILNAMSLPGVDHAKLHDSVSPVNTFRIVFQEYFGAKLPRLSDRSFVFPDTDHLYDFFEVTETVK
jgi:ribosomal protein L11 methylase PrmA